MKFINPTDTLISVDIPLKSGEVYYHKWYTAAPKEEIEIPEGQTGQLTNYQRAEAHGFKPIEIKKSQPVKLISKVEIKPSELVAMLSSMAGIGNKVANEIAEEYSTIEEVKKAIKDGSFDVGGIDKEKKNKIMKA